MEGNCGKRHLIAIELPISAIISKDNAPNMNVSSECFMYSFQMSTFLSWEYNYV